MIIFVNSLILTSGKRCVLHETKWQKYETQAIRAKLNLSETSHSNLMLVVILIIHKSYNLVLHLVTNIIEYIEIHDTTHPTNAKVISPTKIYIIRRW